jgi:hypothetical protein
MMKWKAWQNKKDGLRKAMNNGKGTSKNSLAEMKIVLDNCK